jgi:hypothetical protein
MPNERKSLHFLAPVGDEVLKVEGDTVLHDARDEAPGAARTAVRSPDILAAPLRSKTVDRQVVGHVSCQLSPLMTASPGKSVPICCGISDS